MNQRLFSKIVPERRLVMTFALRQSLQILQMPQFELGQWLNREIEKNPLLELDALPEKKRFEIDTPSPLTLYDHLQNQIRENFSCPEERLLAEAILEHLDERGFIASPLEATVKQPIEKIIAILQTFDPPGIFASDLQESLLLQLKAQGKSNTPAYYLVQTCFDDLLHKRYTAIEKKLGLSALGDAVRNLARLSFRPADAFKQDLATPIHPDLRIERIEGGWTLELIEDELPKFHIQNEYLSLNLDSVEERESLREFKTQAKWICRSLNRRRKLLCKIGRILTCKQAPYLDHKGPLAPLTIKEMAEILGIHDSTLSRALAGKYASTPRGFLSLRSLISATPATETARQTLENLILSENKQHPLTDDQLAQELQARGFPIARRTIAKYRSQLKIGTASQRKHLGICF